MYICGFKYSDEKAYNTRRSDTVLQMEPAHQASRGFGIEYHGLP